MNQDNKKEIIHTITIKFYTKRGIYTDWIWKKVAELIHEDERFTKDFYRITIRGKNNLE